MQSPAAVLQTEGGVMVENVVEMIWANLPKELIQEILVRLPAKSLLKFKCISKAWLSLISSERFAKAHLKISTKNNGYLDDTLIFGPLDLELLPSKNMYTCSISSVIQEGSTDIVYSEYLQNSVHNYVELDCPFLDPNGYRWLVGSCNGLVCLSFSNGGFILWNPATGKSKELPHFGTKSGYFILKSNHGFGYDEVHDDYKVAEFKKVEVDGVTHLVVNVYSQRSNSWKVLTNWPGGNVSKWPGLFINGAIHWSAFRSLKWFIVALDLASDVFVDLPLPSFDDYDDISAVHARKLQGCLALCCSYGNYMNVWVMKEYGVGASWIKVVCIPCFLDDWHTDYVGPFPLFFLGDGKILLNYVSSLRIYDSNNPKPHEFYNIFFYYEGTTVTTFFESLVSPILDEANPV